MKKYLLFPKGVYYFEELKQSSEQELYELACVMMMLEEEKCVFDEKEFTDAWNHGYIDTKESYLFIVEV